MTLLPGYDDDGLGYDARELLRRPGFWAAHLGPGIADGLDEDLAALFGAPLPAVRGTYLRLIDPAGWPVFPIDLGGGARLAVVYRNFEEDEAVDYLLIPAGGPAVLLAVAEGAADGPGLSWAELGTVAARQPDPAAQAQAMLLLAPILGDERAEPARLAAALRTAGVGGDPDTVAARLAAAAPARWRDTGGVNVCDDEDSSRHPHGALTDDERRTVSVLLGEPPAGPTR